MAPLLPPNNGASTALEATIDSDKKCEASNSNTQTYWEDTYDSKRCKPLSDWGTRK